MPFNPNYIPSGPNNKANPYYAKENHVKIAKNMETKEEFLGTPLPATAFALNDPSRVLQNVAIDQDGEQSFVFTSGATNRRTLTWPAFAAGTRVQFNVDVSGDAYFRLGDTIDLGPSAFVSLAPMFVDGPSVAVDVTIPELGTNTAIGFFVTNAGTTVSVWNWVVTAPPPP